MYTNTYTDCTKTFYWVWFSYKSKPGFSLRLSISILYIIFTFFSQSGLASIVSTSSIVRPKSEIKEQTPEERIKELEMKLLAVSKENEAYKKIFKGKPILDSLQKNVTVHTYHDNMMGIPTKKGKCQLHDFKMSF